MSSTKSCHLIVCCKHPEILETLLRVIHQKTVHTAVGCLCVNELNDLLLPAKADMVLIGSGFTDEEEQMILSGMQKNQPDIAVVFHYGGGSGLLHAEINNVMEGRHPSFTQVRTNV